jgi:uncharacterized protein YkwD
MDRRGQCTDEQAPSNGEARTVTGLPESGDVRGSALIVVAASAAVLTTAGPAPARAAAAAPPSSSCAGADQTAAAADVAQTRAAIACLIDAARAERKLPALRVDPRLQTAAQRFARALKPGKPLTHEGRGGSMPIERIEATGYARGAAGFSAAETLGRSRGSLATPATRVKAWLAQPGTRRLLLSARYRDAGVGIVTRGDVTTFVVEIAARQPAAR